MCVWTVANLLMLVCTGISYLTHEMDGWMDGDVLTYVFLTHSCVPL